ncbi:MAG TPA: DivIVA domain-containing protein [Acidimicrobiales bacterium]|nr:DivIVA domain-containing protein [Acidimicrobiales bacterium]
MNDDPRIDPADLRNVRFPGSSRRYDARSVDQFLETVAARIAATNDLVDELRRELFAAQESPAEAPVVERPELSTLDDDALVRLVGEETATVLSTARRAAEEIRSKAEESAARMIREATTEADRTTEDASTRAAELTRDAEQALERATAAAEEEAARIRQEAEEEAERRAAETQERVEAELAAIEERRVEADAEAERILAEAREEGRGMVAEAKDVRHRILEDLQRRRDLARDQIERLLDGRERLLAAYDKVRENLDDITGQLLDALPHPDEGPEPELPDGFVGIVGGSPDEADEGADIDAEERAEVDDTVAPISDAHAEPTEPEPLETAEPDVADREAEARDDAPAPEPEPHAPTETEADEAETSAEEPVADDDDAAPTEPAADVEAPTETEADEAEQHEQVDLEVPGGDVDALFARLRAEREESVARAQEVLEPAAEPEPDTELAPEPESEEVAEAPVAVEAPGAVDAGGDEEATQPAESAGERGGDVDRVPPEFLADEADLARRAEALGPIESRLARALKRRLSDEQNELLDLLRRSGSTTADELLPAADEQIAVWAGLATKHLAAAAAAGAAAGGSEAVDVDVSALADALGAALAEPFRRRVERSAADVGGDPDELDERLRALYREWKVQHIGPVAEDALLSAYALGTLVAAEPDGRVRWRIDPAQGPCPDAQDNALEGAIRAGEAFPTGDACPQAHPGCRCLLVVEPSA